MPVCKDMQGSSERGMQGAGHAAQAPAGAAARAFPACGRCNPPFDYIVSIPRRLLARCDVASRPEGQPCKFAAGGSNFSRHCRE